jgi:hypothetical protein
MKAVTQANSTTLYGLSGAQIPLNKGLEDGISMFMASPCHSFSFLTSRPDSAFGGKPRIKRAAPPKFLAALPEFLPPALA